VSDRAAGGGEERRCDGEELEEACPPQSRLAWTLPGNSVHSSNNDPMTSPMEKGRNMLCPSTSLRKYMQCGFTGGGKEDAAVPTVFHDMDMDMDMDVYADGCVYMLHQVISDTVTYLDGYT
jgi:hypothetical protein